MIRRPLALLLPLVLLAAGCTDRELPTAAPERAAFTHMDANNPVVNSLADPGDGVCDPAGVGDGCTLREAIAYANFGATITFSVTGTITNGSTGGPWLNRWVIDKPLSIVGPGAKQLTITSPDDTPGTGFVITLSSDDYAYVYISGLTITSPQLAYEYEKGGGIYNAGSSRLELRQVTISGNRAMHGGGIYNEGTLEIFSSTISGNLAGSGSGGGIYNVGHAWIGNSTISGNVASGQGGGVYNGGVASVSIENSTISNNYADPFGAGLYNQWALYVSGSIIANNNGGSDCTNMFGGFFEDFGNNIVQDGSCISSESTSRSGDPLLGPLQDNGGPTWTHALRIGSPAIDAYDCGVGSSDQRGVWRPQGSACDIGAFEFQPPTLSINASGSVTRKGVATVSGTVTCPDATPLTLNVTLRQQQQTKKNATPTTVAGSQTVSIASCSGNTAWTATITATTGKFVAGAAEATASVAGTTIQANPTAVQLR